VLTRSLVATTMIRRLMSVTENLDDVSWMWVSDMFGMEMLRDRGLAKGTVLGQTWAEKRTPDSWRRHCPPWTSLVSVQG
jgi:hypothetical protein